MRKLSECHIEGIAYCQQCDEYFIDDVPVTGTIKCPNVKCEHVLIRGLETKGGKTFFKGKEFRP